MTAAAHAYEQLETLSREGWHVTILPGEPEFDSHRLLFTAERDGERREVYGPSAADAVPRLANLCRELVAA